MFIDSATGKELPGPPDPKAGLYIRNRAGKTCHVKIPKHCLAFQTGETLQIASQSSLRAVPHLVFGGEPKLMKGVIRNTLAVFMQPALDDPVGPYQSFAEVAAEILNRGVVKA